MPEIAAPGSSTVGLGALLSTVTVVWADVVVLPAGIGGAHLELHGAVADARGVPRDARRVAARDHGAVDEEGVGERVRVAGGRGDRHARAADERAGARRTDRRGRRRVVDDDHARAARMQVDHRDVRRDVGDLARGGDMRRRRAPSCPRTWSRRRRCRCCRCRSSSSVEPSGEYWNATDAMPAPLSLGVAVRVTVPET